MFRICQRSHEYIYYYDSKMYLVDDGFGAQFYSVPRVVVFGSQRVTDHAIKTVHELAQDVPVALSPEEDRRLSMAQLMYRHTFNVIQHVSFDFGVQPIGEFKPEHSEYLQSFGLWSNNKYEIVPAGAYVYFFAKREDGFLQLEWLFTGDDLIQYDRRSRVLVKHNRATRTAVHYAARPGDEHSVPNYEVNGPNGAHVNDLIALHYEGFRRPTDKPQFTVAGTTYKFNYVHDQACYVPYKIAEVVE